MDRRREIAQHVAGALEKIVAWPVPGDDERDRDYVRRRILDLKELTLYISVILDDRQRQLGEEYSVLDVGTGLGILPLALRGTDIKSSACDNTRFDEYGGWIEKEGVPSSRCDLMEGELPYPSASFDVITFKR